MVPFSTSKVGPRSTEATLEEQRAPCRLATNRILTPNALPLPTVQRPWTPPKRLASRFRCTSSCSFAHYGCGDVCRYGQSLLAFILPRLARVLTRTLFLVVFSVGLLCPLTAHAFRFLLLALAPSSPDRLYGRCLCHAAGGAHAAGGRERSNARGRADAGGPGVANWTLAPPPHAHARYADKRCRTVSAEFALILTPEPHSHSPCFSGRPSRAPGREPVPTRILHVRYP